MRGNKSKNDFRIITVEVPAKLNESLADAAKAKGISKSEAMRQAFVEWLKSN